MPVEFTMQVVYGLWARSGPSLVLIQYSLRLASDTETKTFFEIELDLCIVADACTA